METLERLERLQVFWRCQRSFGSVQGVFKNFWRSQRHSKVLEGFWRQQKILRVVEILQKFGDVGEVLKVLKRFWKCWKIFRGVWGILKVIDLRGVGRLWRMLEGFGKFQ